MYAIKQSTALTVPFFVHNADGDAVTALVDAGFTKRISKNGGAFAAMTVTITEMENGWYSIPLSTGHSDTTGLLTVLFTHASSKQNNLQWRVEARLVDDLNNISTAEVNTQADLALTDYDGPTDAEMIARTLVAASYFDPAADAVANVTLVATTTTNTDVTALNDVSTAQVNAEVVDVLKTDTLTLPAQGAPTATPTMEAVLGWLYKTFRNKKEQSATEWRLFNDAGTIVDSKATVSDAASVATKEEIATGP